MDVNIYIYLNTLYNKNLKRTLIYQRSYVSVVTCSSIIGHSLSPHHPQSLSLYYNQKPIYVVN